MLSYRQGRIPIYGDISTFPEKGNALLTVEGSAECVGFLSESCDRLVARIGYDLFSEVRTLLTAGQPLANASLPSLDLHIAFLQGLDHLAWNFLWSRYHRFRTVINSWLA